MAGCTPWYLLMPLVAPSRRSAGAVLPSNKRGIIMKASLLRALLLASALMWAALPARAVTGSYHPDAIHTYVGLAVFYDQKGEFMYRCSGSLLAPRIFLTAGHCTDDAENPSYARIYFHQGA